MLEANRAYRYCGGVQFPFDCDGWFKAHAGGLAQASMSFRATGVASPSASFVG